MGCSDEAILMLSHASCRPGTRCRDPFTLILGETRVDPGNKSRDDNVGGGEGTSPKPRHSGLDPESMQPGARRSLSMDAGSSPA